VRDSAGASGSDMRCCEVNADDRAVRGHGVAQPLQRLSGAASCVKDAHSLG
jgi:hypothetical protein